MASKPSTPDLSHFSINEIEFNLVDLSYSLRNKTIIRQWMQQAIQKEKKKAGPLSFNFCTDEYLLQVNREHLNHDYYTDIITFDFSEHPIVSGDIYISIDRVKDNAKTEGKTFTNELMRVLIHGVLHLCGYKDKKPADARLMRDKEDYYLSLLGK
jgi:probable rRNA maturation factor